MTIKEVFEYALENKDIDLQALIMFVVMEKKVHDWNDDKSVLDIYFLPKHNERMTELINEYKKKMKLRYAPSHYEVNRSIYIYADNETQAKAFCYANGIEVKEIRLLLDDDLFYLNDRLIEIQSLTKNKKTPYLIGGYKNERI